MHYGKRHGSLAWWTEQGTLVSHHLREAGPHLAQEFSQGKLTWRKTIRSSIETKYLIYHLCFWFYAASLLYVWPNLEKSSHHDWWHFLSHNPFLSLEFHISLLWEKQEEVAEQHSAQSQSQWLPLQSAQGRWMWQEREFLDIGSCIWGLIWERQLQMPEKGEETLPVYVPAPFVSNPWTLSQPNSPQATSNSYPQSQPINRHAFQMDTSAPLWPTAISSKPPTVLTTETCPFWCHITDATTVVWPSLWAPVVARLSQLATPISPMSDNQKCHLCTHLNRCWNQVCEHWTHVFSRFQLIYQIKYLCKYRQIVVLISDRILIANLQTQYFSS